LYRRLPTGIQRQKMRKISSITNRTDLIKESHKWLWINHL
jgi:hypothetical protein